MMKTPGAPPCHPCRAAKRADVNPLRPAMDGVGPRVAGLFEDLLGLDDLMDLRLRWMGLRVHHIDARRADARNDQIAPLEEGVAGERRQGRRAGVPAEMMELVALVRHRHRVDDLAVSRRAALHIDDCERVGLREIAAEQRGIGEFLRRPFHRELRRRVKGRIRSHGHGVSFPICVERNPTAIYELWRRRRRPSMTTIRRGSTPEARRGPNLVNATPCQTMKMMKARGQVGNGENYPSLPPKNCRARTGVRPCLDRRRAGEA